tara:strand:- start:1994 stop:2161 length:168 start_codon:yes stop_codon:yes gene_type:complete
MEALIKIIPAIGVILFITLLIAAIIMPLIVITIDHKLAKVAKTLAAMEHMMRHGK